MRVQSRVRLYTSTTLTLSLYESNRYLLADNGVAINNYKFNNQTPTSTQPTNNESTPKSPNKPISSPKPTFKQLTNTHVTKNSPKPTAKSTSPQSTDQHPSHQTNPSLNRKPNKQRTNNQVILKSPTTLSISKLRVDDGFTG